MYTVCTLVALAVQYCAVRVPFCSGITISQRVLASSPHIAQLLLYEPQVHDYYRVGKPNNVYLNIIFEAQNNNNFYFLI